MYFKAYTRKSSAVEGIKRAGFDPEILAQHEGKWGFFLADTDNPKLVASATYVDDPFVAPRVESAAFVDFSGVTKNNRRKMLRVVYRGMKSIQRANKQPGSPKFSVKFLRDSARRLGQSYRSADIPRA